MCTQDELKIILAELAKVYREVYGDHLSQIILYGSYARGDYQKDSDIDVAAIVDEPRKQVQDGLKTIWNKAHDLGLQFEILISPTAIPQDEFEEYIDASQYYKNIKTEGVLVEE